MESLTRRFLPATLLVMLILLVSSPKSIEAARFVFKSRPPDEFAPFEPMPDIGMPAVAPVTGGTILASRPPESGPPTPISDIPMATASAFTGSSKVLPSRSPKVTPTPPMRHSPIPTADVDGWSPVPDGL